MLQRIGSGSYGEVWLARNAMGTYRAVKVVYRDHFSEDRPYEREFDGIRRFEPISHYPTQVSILHIGRNEQESHFYYVMEVADDQQNGQRIDPGRYEPKTLRSELKKRGRLPFEECVTVGLALATALEHLHNKELVHRDIKPSNVIYVHGLPKLADIGLVAAVGEECSFVGTEGYVAPEGPGRVQADIYALGKLLYEMSTGLSVSRYPSLPEEWGLSAEREAQEFNQVVNRACDANEKRRYQTAADIRADLELLKNQKSLVRLRGLERTRRLLLIGLAGVSVTAVLCGLIVGLLVFRSRAADQNQRRELRDIRIARTAFRTAGWFTNNWPRLKHAAAVRLDREVWEQASAMLEGLDARLVKVHFDKAGASVAFGPDGRAVFGGVARGPAWLMSTDGTLAELPVRGEGPVCWAGDGVPLQFTAVSNVLVLREMLTGVVRRTFSVAGGGQEPLEKLPPLAVTPNGSEVAAYVRGRVLAWNSATGDRLGETTVGASKLEFSPDGSLLAVGGSNGTTHVFGLPGLAQTAMLPPTSRGSPILSLAFGRDPVVHYGAESKASPWVLATGNQGAEIVIWDLERHLPRSFCRGANWNVAALAFSPDGLTLASAGQDLVRLWDVMTGKMLLYLAGESASHSRTVAFDHTGRWLAQSGQPDAGRHALGLWEIEPDRGIKTLRGLVAPVRQIWYSTDSRLVAALSDDWRLATWEIASGHLLHIFETPVGVFADNAAGCFSANNDEFAYATWNEACLYQVETGRALRRWTLPDGLWDQLQFDNRQRLLLLRRERIAEEGRKIWRLRLLADADNPSLLSEQTETNWQAYGMTFGAHGQRFLVWDNSIGGKWRIHDYDTESGRALWETVTERNDGNLFLHVDSSGARFAYAAKPGDQPLPLVDFLEFRQVGTLPHQYGRFSSLGHGFGGTGWIFLDPAHLETAIPMVTDWTGDYMSAFSPNGRFLAWGTADGVLLIANIRELEARLASLSR